MTREGPFESRLATARGDTRFVTRSETLLYFCLDSGLQTLDFVLCALK